MGFIDFLKGLVERRAETWTYAVIPGDKTPIGLEQEDLVPDQSYLSIVLQSFRIVDVRKGLTRFYGTVQSFSQLASSTGDPSSFHVVTTPSELQGVDAAHLDRTITQSIRLLGPVPYSGGDVTLEIGLFSVAEQDLAKPFLDLLVTMSQVAGTAFISTAMPFVAPIEQGVNSLLGGGVGGLEIGLYKGFIMPDQPPQTGYYAIIRAPRGTLDVSTLRVDNEQRLVDDKSGVEIGNYPYLVFSIEKSSNRSDWREVPAVQTSYKELLKQEATGDASKISDALAAFKVSVLASPDLLPSDKGVVIDKVSKLVASVLTALAQPAPRRLPPINLIQ